MTLYELLHKYDWNMCELEIRESSHCNDVHYYRNYAQIKNNLELLNSNVKDYEKKNNYLCVNL